MKSSTTIIIFLLVFINGITFSQFNRVGPFGGLINNITNDNQGRILAATYLGGIFRSSDNGKTWVKITNDTLKADYRSVAVNSNGDIFAGTDGFGLLRSTDDGITWERLSNTLYTRTITSIHITSDNKIFTGTFNGLYLSEDNGKTFIKSGNGITTSQIYSIAGNNNTLFAGTYYAGVFRSTDDGASWTEANNGMTFNNLIIYAFAFNSSGNIITTTGTKVYLSSDDGDNWNDLNAPTSNYVSVAVGTNDNFLAAGTDKIYRSADNGGSWNELNSWPENVPSIQYLFSNNEHIYVGTRGRGVYNSSDNGDTWSLDVTGMTNTHVNEIASGPNGELYAATKYAGLFYSSDDGDTWENRTNNLPATNDFLTKVAVNPKTGTVFVATSQSNCYRSTDQGEVWEEMTNGLTAVTFEFNSEGHVYTGYGVRFYKSTDDGVTWIPRFPNVSPISDIAVGLNDYVYLATDGAGVSLSMDGGDSWNPINDGLTNLNVKFIEAFTDTSASFTKKSENCRAAVCATQNQILEFDGTKWTLSEDNFYIVNKIKQYFGPEGQVSSKSFIAFMALLLYYTVSECDETGFFVGYEHDMSEDEDIPDKVEVISGAAENIKNTDGFNKRNNYSTDDFQLFLGTNGGGIYKGTVTPTGIEDKKNVIPDKYYLAQNYPNPFNPTTTIQFALPKGAFTSLEIFNVLGEKVSTLVSENLSAGSYKYDWNASLLPSGVYFYRLSTENFNQTKKLILMK